MIDLVRALKIVTAVLECCVNSGMVPETTLLEFIENEEKITVRQALDMADKVLEETVRESTDAEEVFILGCRIRDLLADIDLLVKALEEIESIGDKITDLKNEHGIRMGNIAHAAVLAYRSKK